MPQGLSCAFGAELPFDLCHEHIRIDPKNGCSPLGSKLIDRRHLSSEHLPFCILFLMGLLVMLENPQHNVAPKPPQIAWTREDVFWLVRHNVFSGSQTSTFWMEVGMLFRVQSNRDLHNELRELWLQCVPTNAMQRFVSRVLPGELVGSPLSITGNFKKEPGQAKIY